MREALKKKQRKISKIFYKQDNSSQVWSISSDKWLRAHLNLILRTILGPASISQPEPRTPFVWGYFSHPTPIHLGDRSLILEIRSSYFLGKIILTLSEERKWDNLISKFLFCTEYKWSDTFFLCRAVKLFVFNYWWQIVHGVKLIKLKKTHINTHTH